MKIRGTGAAQRGTSFNANMACGGKVKGKGMKMAAGGAIAPLAPASMAKGKKPGMPAFVPGTPFKNKAK